MYNFETKQFEDLPNSFSIIIEKNAKSPSAIPVALRYLGIL
jgi:hypothetical protein